MLAVIHHPEYDAKSVPSSHRFPMRKYSRLARRLEDSGLITAENPFIEPVAADYLQVASAHHPDYVRNAFNLTLDKARIREIGFELNEDVVYRSRLSCGGTLLAAHIAMDEGIACNGAGGSHHARYETGAGFCVFNDVAVAITALRSQGVIRKAMIIDCDVHQGDGSADIFSGDDTVFTLSVHCEDNWPTRKVYGDMDVGLPVGMTDDAYLARLKDAVQSAFDIFTPDIVFYNAGVDVHADDRLGKLSLTENGIARRDALVLGMVREHHCPVVGVMGGGYNRDNDRLIDLHASLFEAASELT